MLNVWRLNSSSVCRMYSKRDNASGCSMWWMWHVHILLSFLCYKRHCPAWWPVVSTRIVPQSRHAAIALPIAMIELPMAAVLAATANCPATLNCSLTISESDVLHSPTGSAVNNGTSLAVYCSPRVSVLSPLLLSLETAAVLKYGPMECRGFDSAGQDAESSPLSLSELGIGLATALSMLERGCSDAEIESPIGWLPENRPSPHSWECILPEHHTISHCCDLGNMLCPSVWQAGSNNIFSTRIIDVKCCIWCYRPLRTSPAGFYSLTHHLATAYFIQHGVATCHRVLIPFLVWSLYHWLCLLADLAWQTEWLAHGP